jgi:hypothetical protein
MNRSTSVYVALAASLTITSPSFAQQADTAQEALKEIGEWLSSQLPKFGRFSIGISGDWSSGDPFRSGMGIRAREARHDIRDVSLQQCELQFLSELSAPGVTGPISWKVALPLAAIDVGWIRVQPYDLPTQLRATTPRWEVYLRAVPASQGFLVTDSDGVERAVWELSVPINRSRNAERVAEKLRQGASLCRT